MKDHYIPNPDWSIFSQHTERYLPDDTQRRGCIITELSYFTCLSDNMRTEFLYKTVFPSVDHVPSCIKYISPKTVNFVNANPVFCGSIMTSINVNIQALINIDHEHFLNLHPVRYDKVKEAIVLGEINMPLVSICKSEGFPRVEDGRHRIISMFKYGFENADILVPKNEAEEIIKQLEEGVVRKPTVIDFSIGKKDFKLECFLC